MIPLTHEIDGLIRDTSQLPEDWTRVDADLMAGRIDVMTARQAAQAARAALDAGDEARATLLMLDAQAAWIRALRMQLPARNRARLDVRPDVGGRPSGEWLAERLQDAVDAGPSVGTIIARCRAVIAADEMLHAAYGDKPDNTVRKAYRWKKRD